MCQGAHGTKRPSPAHARTRAPMSAPGAISPVPVMLAQPNLAVGPIETGPTAGPGPSLASAHCQGGTRCAGLGLPWCPQRLCSVLGQRDRPGSACCTSTGSLHCCALTKFLLEMIHRNSDGVQSNKPEKKNERHFIRHILVTSSTLACHAAVGVMESSWEARSRRCFRNTMSSAGLLGSALVMPAQRREKRQKQRHLNKTDC